MGRGQLCTFPFSLSSSRGSARTATDGLVRRGRAGLLLVKAAACGLQIVRAFIIVVFILPIDDDKRTESETKQDKLRQDERRNFRDFPGNSSMNTGNTSMNTGVFFVDNKPPDVILSEVR